MSEHLWTVTPTRRTFGWVLAEAGGRVFLRAATYTHGEPGELMALDAESGVGLWSAPLCYSRIDSAKLAIGDGWLAAHEGELRPPNTPFTYSTVALNPETGERLWCQPHSLVAGAGAHVFLRPDVRHLAVVRGADGGTVARVPLTAEPDGWHSWSYSALISDGGLWYLGSGALMRIEDGPEGWGVTERIAIGEAADTGRLALVGDRLCVAMTRNAGTETALLSLEGDGVLREFSAVPGRLTGLAGGGWLTVWTSVNEKTAKLTALTLDGASITALSTAPSYGAVIAATTDTALTQLNGGFVVIRQGEAGLTMTRLAAPEGYGVSWVVGEGRVWSCVADKLMRLELASLPYAPEVDLRYRWWDVPAPTHTPPYYARVTAVGPETATADHPELGEVTLRGGAGLKVRDRVSLDEVRELMPGYSLVRRWHKAHTEPAPLQEPCALVLPASALTPLPAAPVATVTEHEPALRACAVEREFPLSPLMVAFFERYDQDEHFRDRVHYTGLHLGIDGYTNCWLGTDVSIVGFAGDGSGQMYGFYLYPPAMTPETPAPIVYWDHETRGVSWLAADFDTFLAEHLSSRTRWHKNEYAEHVREALGLERTDEVHRVAPEWFQAAHRDSSMSLESALLLSEDDPVAAERALVALHRERERSKKIYAALERLYGSLGWPYHLRNLQKAEEVARPYQR